MNGYNKVAIMGLLMISIILLSGLNITAQEINQNVIFSAGPNDFFTVNLRLKASDIKIMDDRGNILNNGDFVCDLKKDQLSVEDNLYIDGSNTWDFTHINPPPVRRSTWFFDGGRTSDPEIVWDRNLVSEIITSLERQDKYKSSSGKNGQLCFGWNIPSPRLNEVLSGDILGKVYNITRNIQLWKCCLWCF